jgi:endonuclease/exonuclease/phosphatase (EEP) superfamily protein YafD
MRQNHQNNPSRVHTSESERPHPLFFDTLKASVLWGALFFALFVYHGAWLLPEKAVSIRILASVLCDLVWMPLGFGAWFAAIRWITGIILRSEHVFFVFLRNLTAFITVLMGLAGFHDAMFRFLFIPLALLIIRSLASGAFRDLRLVSPGIPFWLFAVLLVDHYGWQLAPRFVFTTADNANLRIMTYNINANADSEDRLQVIETIVRESPDIVCLEEVNYADDLSLFRGRLENQYPYIVSNSRVSGIRTSSLILSKHPIAIKPVKVKDFGVGNIDFTFYEATIGKKNLNLVNFHLITVGHHFERIHRYDGDIGERLASTSENEAAIDETRYVQVRRIREFIDTLKGPVVLCGDLNDTPNSRVYRYLTRRYEDSFKRCGWGLGPTFGASWLQSKARFRRLPYSTYLACDLIRIDHVLTGGGIEPVSARVISGAQGSDHKPVVVSMKLP